jgi:hypothetical protein
MNRTLLAVGAAILLAACQPAATTEEAPPAPQTMHDQVAAMGPEEGPVFAYQLLVAYQQTHPEAAPPCTAVRGAERITMPENIAPDSIYAPHAGALVYSVQCGALISATRMDPSEKWLVAFAPGADAPTVENCAGPRESDRCPRQVPTAAPATP